MLVIVNKFMSVGHDIHVKHFMGLNLFEFFKVILFQDLFTDLT